LNRAYKNLREAISGEIASLMLGHVTKFGEDKWNAGNKIRERRNCQIGAIIFYNNRTNILNYC